MSFRHYIRRHSDGAVLGVCDGYSHLHGVPRRIAEEHVAKGEAYWVEPMSADPPNLSPQDMADRHMAEHADMLARHAKEHHELMDRHADEHKTVILAQMGAPIKIV